MKIIQSRSFEKRVKKFSRVQKAHLDEQVKLITPQLHKKDGKKAKNPCRH
jgi:hypothetical protein